MTAREEVISHHLTASRSERRSSKRSVVVIELKRRLEESFDCLEASG